MRPILAVTPNPSVDRTLLVPGFAAGQVWRAARVLAATGGKGVNVARTLIGCGRPTAVLGLLGGHTGRLAAALAVRDRLPAQWIWVAGETRTCTIVAGDDGRETTVVNEEGPTVAVADWDRFTRCALDAVAPGDLVALSGSVPGGVAPAAVTALAAGLVAAGARLFVDMTGDPLAAAAAARPAAIKINEEEAAGFLGHPVAPADAAAAARSLAAATGVPLVSITLGAAGAVLADADGAWRAQALPVRPVSTVGSGDAFLAGLLMALAEGRPPPAALGHAVAAGTANALAFGGGVVTADALAEMERAVTVAPAALSEA